MAGSNKRISRTTNRFSEVPEARISRSTFNRSHGLKTTFDASDLVPMFLDEVLPGDTFNLRMNGFCRMATPDKPIMDNLYLDTFFFFVPNRLVWDNWQAFMGEVDDPVNSVTEYVIPTVTLDPGVVTPGTLYDFMGIPPNPTWTHNVNALPFRAYNLIFNEWFRDETLAARRQQVKDDGPDSDNWYNILRRGKRHDYFTSALPWPQAGPSVSLPLGGRADVWTDSAEGDAVSVKLSPNASRGLTNAIIPPAVGENVVIDTIAYPESTVIYANLADATAATINDLRSAFQIQKLLERDARGGRRYTELLKSHFGVTSPDARLQRPEYLGGGSTRININPVAQTVPEISTGGTPQANLAAVGTASWQGHGFAKSFTEHGYIIGLMSVRADLTYQQGVERHYWRQTRYDYFWPALQHLGEQAIENREIYAVGAPEDTQAFGFQERYAEYRYKPSQITGKFRSQVQPGDETDLDVWHLAQEFSTRPVLSEAFIQEDVPMDRILAVPTEPDFLFDGWFDLKCARPMPVYGVPGLIDHF